MPYGSSDLSTLLADFGETAVFSTYTTKALLDFETDVQDMGGQLSVLGNTISIVIAAGSLPGLKKASAITVAGTSYHVREIHNKEDGALLTVFLEVG